MLVIGIAAVGVAAGLCERDLFAQHARPFLPAEQALLMQMPTLGRRPAPPKAH